LRRSPSSVYFRISSAQFRATTGAYAKNYGISVVFRNLATALANARKWRYNQQDVGKIKVFEFFGKFFESLRDHEVAGSSPVAPTFPLQVTNPWFGLS
jgi:hypothetical protein